MSEKDVERRNRFFEELTICLLREGFTVQPQENAVLPVLRNGLPLCRVVGNGDIRYRQDDIIDADMERALDQVTHISSVTAEYMKQMKGLLF